MVNTVKEIAKVTYDSIFKKVFSSKENRKIISYLISNITKIDYSYIYENFIYANTELLKKKYNDKGKVTDLLIYLKEEIINIEMNKYVSKGTRIKNNVYHHSLSASSIKKGEKYNKAKKVIQINIDGKGSKIKKLIHESKMRDKEGIHVTDNNYITYHVNLEIALKKWYNKEKLTRLEKILVMMQLNDKEKLKEIAKGDEMLMVFGKSIDEANEEIGVYDKEAADEFVRQIDIADAEEKGTKRGVKQGLKMGIAQKAKEIAKNMLKKNMPLEDISELTGLNQKEISKLADN